MIQYLVQNLAHSLQCFLSFCIMSLYQYGSMMDDPHARDAGTTAESRMWDVHLISIHRKV